MLEYRQIEMTRVAEQFRALGNPSRLELFLRIANCCQAEPPDGCCAGDRRQVSVGEAAECIDVSASTVSHHLKELRAAGLVQAKRFGQRVAVWVEPTTLRGLGGFFRDLIKK